MIAALTAGAVIFLFAPLEDKNKPLRPWHAFGVRKNRRIWLQRSSNLSPPIRQISIKVGLEFVFGSDKNF